MLETIFSVIVLGAILSIPIVLWAYVFTFLSSAVSSKRVFFSGLFAGGVTVIPIVYIGSWIPYISHVLPRDIFSTMLGVFLGLCIFISFLTLIWWVYNRCVKNLFLLRVYIYFLISIVFLVGIFFLLEIGVFGPLGISFLNSSGVGLSIGAIVVYYLVVGCIEEFSKALGVFGTSPKQVMSTGFTTIIMVALGFAFIENILYVYEALQKNGISGEIIQIGLSRSIFSVMLHVLCSVVMYQSLVSIYGHSQQRESLLLGWGSILAIIFVSLVLHSLYDIFLTLGFTFIVFVYFIGGYMYVGRDAYQEKISGNI